MNVSFKRGVKKTKINNKVHTAKKLSFLKLNVNVSRCKLLIDFFECNLKTTVIYRGSDILSTN